MANTEYLLQQIVYKLDELIGQVHSINQHLNYNSGFSFAKQIVDNLQSIDVRVSDLSGIEDCLARIESSIESLGR